MLTYGKRLYEYADEGGRPRVTGSRSDLDGAIVSSEIMRGSGQWTGSNLAAQLVKVDWRLTAQNGSYKVSDIIIDGLSMAATDALNLKAWWNEMAGALRLSLPFCGNRLRALPLVKT